MDLSGHRVVGHDQRSRQPIVKSSLSVIPSFLATSSCEDESGIDILVSSSSANPGKEQHTERVFTKKGVREFLVVERTGYPLEPNRLVD
jgi:hypothetical protein